MSSLEWRLSGFRVLRQSKIINGPVFGRSEKVGQGICGRMKTKAIENYFNFDLERDVQTDSYH